MFWSFKKAHLFLLALTLSTVTAFSAESDLNKEGWRLYRLGEFKAAVEAFESLRSSGQPGSEAEIEGLYGEASCWNFRRDRRDTARAIQLYDRLLSLAPEHPLAAWAALDRVRAEYLGAVDFDRNPDIAHAFGEVAKTYEGTPAGEEAFFLSMNQQVPGMDSVKAAQLHKEIGAYLRRHPKSLFLSQLYQLRAACYAVLGQQSERLANMVLALESREYDQMSSRADSPLAYWQIAYIAEFQAGDFRLAREYYQRLIREYPKDIRIFGARRALERMDAVEAAVRAGQPIPSQWKEAGQP
jgi:tetratricopeptide (TPR) repeat protein